MKQLSRDEMKKVMGGDPDPTPCNVPADCGANNCDNPDPGQTKHHDCRNHWCFFDTNCA